MKTLKKFLSALLAGLLALTPPVVYPAFDPVNDDTDIFLANPNITANRPNVLLALDNTANWNQAFVNEKSALVSVVNGLKDGEFNVGLMMMAEVGVGNDNVDGAYVRFHVRQMIGTAKTNLATMVGNLHINNDKSNNAGHGQSLFEAYLYFAGLPAVGGVGKVKADHDGTTDTLLTPFVSPNHALPGPDASNPARPSAGSSYRTPIADSCAKNFVILISNGKADTSNAELATMQARVQALTGSDTPLPVVGGGQRISNWSDEMAQFMAGVDLDGSTTNGSLQNITTYVVEVDRGSQPEDLEWTEVMKNTADKGGGKYFSVSSDASGAAIIDALNSIFAEIQAVNTVFAATTLPVSVNVRGTNVNQVYVGVFRPDAKKAPKWLGNLKMYQLALDSQDNVFLADATGAAAENLSTGFVLSTARSFWTTDSGNFWQFAVTPTNPNGAGGAKDTPDGDLVEKGGAAQQIRIFHPNAENPQVGQVLRRIYTCTDGGSFATQCAATADSGVTPGSQLSQIPFSDSNTDITTALLGIGTIDVSPLTAFATQTVTTLTDRKSVSINNANPATSVTITGFSNGATATLTVAGSGTPTSNLKTSTPRFVNSISGLQSGTVSVSITSITKVGGNFRVLVGAGLSGVTVGTVLPSITCTGGVNAFADFNSLSAANRTVNGVTSATDFTIPGPSGGPTPSCNAGTLQGPGQVASNLINVSLTNHGFTAGNPVTIGGATTFTNLNGTTSGITVLTTDSFSFSPPPGGGTAGLELGPATAAANTTTARATSTAHGIQATDRVTIYGASPSGYNVSIPSFTAGGGVIVDADTFTYPVGSPLSDNTSTTVYAVRNGSTTVTASAAGHGFNNGDSVTICCANITGYDGTVVISNVVPGVSFDYTTTSILPANTGGTVLASSGGGTLATVTATVANHGFADGSTIIIEGAAPHAGTWGPITLDPIDPANKFSYSTGVSLASPSGAYTVRSSTAPKAYATLVGHGYASGNVITISGATPAGYNGAKTITVVDANNFTYDVAAGIGVNTGSPVTASIKTTTARATAVAHGFGTAGSTASVTITGAVSETSPSPFNGTFTVTIVDANSFTYPIGTAQGDATGTIRAAGVSSSSRTSLINWVRGEDNISDENSSGSTSDIRASVHGDVLHSRPAVINYNRAPNSEDDVYVFYGANDGMFHAVKGGRAATPATSTLSPGQEAWAFIAQEFFASFQRMRANSPTISSSFKKPYFMDGSIGVYTKDANNDGKLVAADGDRVILYITNRRGGRFIYALDVSDPENPYFMWKIDTATTGFGELGQTWSQPTVVAEGVNGYPKPVLVFGGGYDPTVEDKDPATITVFDSTKVTTADGDFIRSMGRAVYVVDALSGALVWSGGKFVGATTAVPDMHYAIPSDVSVIKNLSGGSINRAYVGDTGGQMWRIDFKSSDPTDPTIEDLNGTTVSKIASIADHTTIVSGKLPGLRKFLHAPDVVGQVGFDAILVGSGDREHPFDTGVINRFYMFKDKGTDVGPITGVTEPTITEAPIAGPPAFAGLSDLTSNCIQDAAGCLAGETQSGVTTKLGTDRGWFITLFTGEKVIGNAISLGGVTFFNTNQPSTGTSGPVCTANLGIARQYAVSTVDATVVNSNIANPTAADRSTVYAGGGYLPPPVHVVVVLDGKPVEAVISGIKVTEPPGVTLSARLRKYWYKEIEK